jgi:outer membrane receptor protein involved in Fe transport
MPYHRWTPPISLLIHFSGVLALGTLAAAPAPAQETGSSAELETIEVIGVTPTHGIGLPERRIPYNVQTATSDDLNRAQSLDLTDFMKRHLGSVVTNDAQNNPLQPDIQFRGFTASPLLGLPQGLAVYQNSVRVNEVLGDTINWDLIPESAIAGINLIGGANPLFGLNTLGGAISVATKNGFTHPGHRAEIYGGSFERIVTSAESGGNNGTWGYFATANYFDEDGWRDASPSDALNFFGALSFRDGNRTSADLNFTYADTELIGNGPAPVELLARDREAIFTSPDITENRMYFLDLEGQHWLNEVTLLSGNVFYRDNDTDSFNGDGTEFEECALAAGFLCEEDDPATPIEDQFGNPIAAFNADGSERNAINNISARDQRNFGGSLQATFLPHLFDRENQLIVGTSYSQGFAEFFSNLEIASLNADRSTAGTGLFVPEEGTFIDTQSRSWSVYVTDTIALTERLDLTVSARYNNTGVKITDKGGDSDLTEATPELTGEHDYERINPAVGITYAFTPALSGYASYSESSRAPTPIELACANPDAPCNLPNAFLADPPLDQVVAESWEGGLRGLYRGNIRWHLGAFRTENSDDIIFISTGGVTANEGFFSNIGETQRLGVELGLDGSWNKLDWFLNYSYVRATFETDFRATSPNHPLADADGEIQVRDGDRIPGVPLHTLKMGGDYALTPEFSVGAELLYSSGVYLRGDEANLLDTTGSYAIVNLRGEYRFAPKFTLFARINNVFDKDYETFGLLGEADEIPGFEDFEDNRFLGPGEPISGFVGIRVEL